MANGTTEGLATDNATSQDQSLNELAEQVKTSFEQTGKSKETLKLVREYVGKFVQDGHQEYLHLDLQPSLTGSIMGYLGIVDNDIKSEVANMVANLAVGKACAPNSPSQKPQQGADPIEMFSGQFLQETTDIVINGAGIDFAFRRTYKNQVVYNGPLGAKWDHSYNLYLRQLGDNIIRSSGELREDLYTKHPKFVQVGFDYWVPPSGRHGVIEEYGTSFTWRSPGGVKYFYKQDPADLLFHRIQKIQDRFGNYLTFTYQDDRLQRVKINNPGRFVVFDYDTIGRIATIHDHTGRKWTFTFDDYGDLVNVTSPATDRYPSGLTTTYEYSSSDYPAPLQHNLLRIIDPAGQLYLENEYGTNAGLLGFNRVVRQRQGKGEYLFEYETVVQEFEFDYNDSEKPAIQVNHTLRNGQMVHYIYNTFGNLLFQEEYISRGRTRRLAQWRYLYNRDGALIGSISPEGAVTQYYYGRDDYLRVNNVEDEDMPNPDSLTASERMAFGNLLTVVRRGKRYDLAQMNLNRGVWGDFFPDILGATDPHDIVVKRTYEPDYQQILTVSDPRYNKGPSYSQHLTHYDYSAMPLKALTHIRYPDTAFPATLPNGDVGLTNISEEYQYDTHGRLERVQYPEGNITENRYFPGTATARVKEGYLRQVIQDINNLGLTTTYEVNDAGIVTSTTNARQVQTTLVVNELNQTIETISGGPGFRSRSFFDKNGLVERQERDNLDDKGQPSLDGDEVKTYRYDEQNNLTRETSGGADLTKHHIIHHRYDSSDKRILTTLPVGNKIRFKYDERLLLKETVRGASSPIASTSRTFYDGDGHKIEVVDGRGNITRFDYDTFGRVVRTTDALDNVLQNEFDKLGNVLITRFFERNASGTYQMLQRSEFIYDERGDRIREYKYLFLLPIQTTSIESHPDAEFILARHQGLVTRVEAQFFYDKNKRLFRVVNAKGQETNYEYDGVNRRILKRDNAGNYTQTFYDENSSVVRLDRHELVRDPLTGTLIREDVFSIVNEYDALDRRIATIDGLGNRTTFTYDSRNNLASITDPLGNIKRNIYDVFARKSCEIVEMTETGLGGSTRLPDIVTRFTYDDNDRLTSIVDANGNATQFAYDALNRQYQTTYVDGSNIHLTFDTDDNVIIQRDSNGLQMLYSVDPLNRRIRMDLDKTGLNPLFPYPAKVEEFEAYVYDGLGRVLQHKNDFYTSTSKFDSLGRSYVESIQFSTAYPSPGGVLTLGRSFDALSNRIDIEYPRGRKIHYDYDELNRLDKITNITKGAGYPGSANFLAQYDIASYEYRGLRLAKVTYGNQAGYEMAYDGNGRLVSTHHTSSNILLDIQQLFDGAGNQRFQLDNPAVGVRPNGEAYKYDSLYRLTKYERQPLSATSPAQFEPPSVPLTIGQMNGQQAINNAIGPLAQDPLDYVYKYDALGNRQEEKQASQPPVAYVANILNQYESRDAIHFQYDLNGNLLDDGTRRYFYNYRNLLVSVQDKTATSTDLLELAYDATGRLIAFREGASAVHLINDGLNVIDEYIGANLTRQYVYENGVDQRCQLVVGGEEWWYHGDLIGSTRLLSDSTGQVPVSGLYEYDPFGALVGAPAQVNPYLFAGKRLFNSVGIYDSRARQYSPKLGRFLQRDPKGQVDGPNLYIYGGNNPVSFIDPFGTEKGPTISSSTPQAEEENIIGWVNELVTGEGQPHELSPLRLNYYGAEYESKVQATVNHFLKLGAKEGGTRYDMLKTAWEQVAAFRANNSDKQMVKSSESTLLRDTERYILGRFGIESAAREKVIFNQSVPKSIGELIGPEVESWYSILTLITRPTGLMRSDSDKPQAPRGGGHWFDLGIKHYFEIDAERMDSLSPPPLLDERPKWEWGFFEWLDRLTVKPTE